MSADHSKCQSIYKGLLDMFDKEKNKGANCVDFVAKLLRETPQCDEYGSLEDVRHAYMKSIAEMEQGAIGRIVLDKNVDESDEWIAMKAVKRHGKWTQKRLVSNLSWRNWWSMTPCHDQEIEETPLVKNSTDWIKMLSTIHYGMAYRPLDK